MGACEDALCSFNGLLCRVSSSGNILNEEYILQCRLLQIKDHSAVTVCVVLVNPTVSNLPTKIVIAVMETFLDLVKKTAFNSNYVLFDVKMQKGL